ncbi:MAG: hypothetical protein U0414_22410 [Polyangiaceae bacterium]
MTDDFGKVTLKLGESELYYATTYGIQQGIFDVPSAFAVSIGMPSDKLSGAMQVIPNRTPFELAINGCVQFRGRIDSRSAQISDGGTSLRIEGRDMLQDLFDRVVTSERSYTGLSIVELVTSCLDDVYGQRDGYQLFYAADLARVQMTGDGSKSAGPGGPPGGVRIALPKLDDDSDDGPETLGGFIDRANAKDAKGFPLSKKDIITLGQLSDPNARTLVVPLNAVREVNARQYKNRKEFRAAIAYLKAAAKSYKASPGPPPKPTATSKVGSKMYEGLLAPELDRAGLFLWHAGADQIILGAPNVTQAPIARIERRLSGRNGKSAQVVDTSFNDNARRRYTSYTVHAKAGGGAQARTFKDGTAVDLEMLSLGYLRPNAIEDSKCKSNEQAQALAQRKLATDRRAGWSLEYTVRGHVTESLRGTRAVWAFDTMVEVIDEVLGIEGVFYVESVEHQRSLSGTTTKLRLMRPADALFGDGSGIGPS